MRLYLVRTCAGSGCDRTTATAAAARGDCGLRVGVLVVVAVVVLVGGAGGAPAATCCCRRRRGRIWITVCVCVRVEAENFVL